MFAGPQVRPAWRARSAQQLSWANNCPRGHSWPSVAASKRTSVRTAHCADTDSSLLQVKAVQFWLSPHTERPSAVVVLCS